MEIRIVCYPQAFAVVFNNVDVVFVRSLFLYKFRAFVRYFPLAELRGCLTYPVATCANLLRHGWIQLAVHQRHGAVHLYSWLTVQPLYLACIIHNPEQIIGFFLIGRIIIKPIQRIILVGFFLYLYTKFRQLPYYFFYIFCRNVRTQLSAVGIEVAAINGTEQCLVFVVNGAVFLRLGYGQIVHFRPAAACNIHFSVMTGNGHVVFYLFQAADDWRTACFQHGCIPLVWHQYTIMHIPVNIGVADKLAGVSSIFVLRICNGLKDVSRHDETCLSCSCWYLAVPVLQCGGTCRIPIIVGRLVNASQRFGLRQLDFHTPASVKSGEHGKRGRGSYLAVLCLVTAEYGRCGKIEHRAFKIVWHEVRLPDFKHVQTLFQHIAVRVEAHHVVVVLRFYILIGLSRVISNGGLLFLGGTFLLAVDFIGLLGNIFLRPYL